MARKAVNVPDNSKARAQRGNTTSQQKPTKVSNATKTSGVTGSQPKKGSGVTIRENTAKAPTRKVGDTMNPKGAANREGAGGYGANTFTGKRGAASQKQYSVTKLKDGGGGKGADGK